MTAKLAETQLWQQNMASLIRSGLFSKAVTGEMNGLYTVVGVYVDETCSAPLAKYSDLRRATDAANLVNQLAKVRPSDRVELILATESRIAFSPWPSPDECRKAMVFRDGRLDRKTGSRVMEVTRAAPDGSVCCWSPAP